ncbi:FAD:protein FMN transferase [Bermanella sp. R86510]|uniref:FAD:protein FMN transferase n=1 Tax=unclassified Bermanella TaxID=2627862 RepID=UPI0037CC92EE
MNNQDSSVRINKTENGYIGYFRAMASPCEVHIETSNQGMANDVVKTIADEAWRIEAKFSRYRTDNLLYRINQHEYVELDDELKRLMVFSQQCFELSEGLFDITSGILRKVWTFDCSDRVPKQSDITPLLENIGFEKLQYDGFSLHVPEGMEIDFGGIGKEYAVDRCMQLATNISNAPILVNFGGDLLCNGPRAVVNGKPVSWQVGIEKVGGGASAILSLNYGAIATSGDARRYLLKEGIRYSHILNPKTGLSITSAPRSISVAASTCIEAGLFSTLAMLQGHDAEAFLQEQGVAYWLQE